MYMPRYDTGDIVRTSGRLCRCGRGLPLIDHVVGRQNEVVVDCRGAAVHSEFFTHLLREDKRVSTFQIVFDKDQLQINLHTIPLSSREQEIMIAPYRKRITEALIFKRLDFVFNQAFFMNANGKRQFVFRRSDS